MTDLDMLARCHQTKTSSTEHNYTLFATTYKRTYIKIYAISIIVRFNYLHGARSASGELIGSLVKVSLG